MWVNRSGPIPSLYPSDCRLPPLSFPWQETVLQINWGLHDVHISRPITGLDVKQDPLLQIISQRKASGFTIFPNLRSILCPFFLGQRTFWSFIRDPPQTSVHTSVTIWGRDLIFTPKMHNDKTFYCMSLIWPWPCFQGFDILNFWWWHKLSSLDLKDFHHHYRCIYWRPTQHTSTRSVWCMSRSQ